MFLWMLSSSRAASRVPLSTLAPWQKGTKERRVGGKGESEMQTKLTGSCRQTGARLPNPHEYLMTVSSQSSAKIRTPRLAALRRSSERRTVLALSGVGPQGNSKCGLSAQNDR